MVRAPAFDTFYDGVKEPKLILGISNDISNTLNALISGKATIEDLMFLDKI